VWFFGGLSVDRLIAAEAKRAGAATLAYLVNGNYRAKRWCRDVDMILTDSQATAGFYKDRLGIAVQPVGSFIRPEAVMAQDHTRRCLTFVNPKPEKGAYLVAQLALALETRRPDIPFEVVDSRAGSWDRVLARVRAALSLPGEGALSNVTVTPATSDMRPVYGRARALLAPSLWWESGARVLAEAMLNGVPAVVTKRGGSPEMIGEGGIVLTLPEIYHEAPYTRLLAPQALEAVIGILTQIHDDEDGYGRMVAAARAAGRDLHDIARNTDRLVKTLGHILPIPSPDG
jgi:glycosyltransferase involved in cell wall biosynthesis